MKTAVTYAQPALASASTEAALAAAGNKVAAYVSLTKPRIVVMVLVTVGVGFLLGARGSAHPATLSLTLLGTALVAGGASTLNQWMERARDARMRRTANRALPRGRLARSRPPRSGSGWGWRARRSCSGVPTGWLPRLPSPRSCFTSLSIPR